VPNARKRLFDELESLLGRSRSVTAPISQLVIDLAYVVAKRPFHVTEDGKGKPILDLFA